MKLAFYIAKYGDWKDKVINSWTLFYGYSHVELVFSNGVCFSASPREGKVRFKVIKNLYTSGHWVFKDINEEYESTVYDKCKKLDGMLYDWKGIFLHQIWMIPELQNRFGTHDKDKYWCSEAIQEVTGRKPVQISPNYMAKKYGIPKQDNMFNIKWRT